jgi:hypothetical protein
MAHEQDVHPYTILEDFSGDRGKQILSHVGEMKRNSSDITLRTRSSEVYCQSLTNTLMGGISAMI